MLQGLFYFVLLGLIFAAAARIPVSENSWITLCDISVASFVGYWLISSLLQKISIQIPKLFLPLILVVSTMVLSLIINSGVLQIQQFLVAALYLFRWVMYAGVYFVVANFSLQQKKKSSIALTVAFTVIIGIGFLQYFLYPDLRGLYYLGWDEHLYRIFGTFFDPNFMGTFFAIVCIFTLQFFFYHKRQKNIISFFFLLLFVFSFLATILTYSRSAYLALLVSVVLMLLLEGKKKIIYAVFCVVFITIALLSYSPKSEGTNLFRTTSIFARFSSAKLALSIIAKNPLFGVGFNAYAYAQERQGYLVKIATRENHAAAGTDMSLLFITATTGLVGLSAYLFLWFCLLKNSWTIRNTTTNTWHKTMATIVLVSHVGFFVSAFFINALFFPYLMLLMWILIGLSEDVTAQILT